MKELSEIVKDPRLRNVEMAMDGFKADIHIGGWDGSLICSTDCGFEHVSVAPFAKRITPQWDDMCNIKKMFWNSDEAVIQIHPKEEDYVNNVPNCLHLWRCTYRDFPLPPSCLVGIRKGQTREELEREIKEAYEMAEFYKDRDWRDIKGYEGLYQISNSGNVRTMPRYDANGFFKESQILKKVLANTGYYVVTLYKNGKGKQHRIHRLVAEHFIPNPNNYPMINHKDEIRTNNCVENLEWCDVTYNNNYGNRLNKVAMRMGKAIVCKELSTGKEHFFFSINQAARETGSNTTHISEVADGKRNQHNHRTWRYATNEEIKEAYELAGEKYE